MNTIKDLLEDWKFHIQPILPVVFASGITFLLVTNWGDLFQRVLYLVLIGLMCFAAYLRNQTSFYKGEIKALKWAKHLGMGGN